MATKKKAAAAPPAASASTKRRPARRRHKLPEAWPATKIETRALSALVPYARNARTHSKAQVKKLAASIREWGWTNPVLVDEDDTIIAGHGRVLAAELLGIEAVPVMVARGWSGAQRRAYLLADNRLALDADWDNETLGVEIGELQGLDFDLALTGFDGHEVRALLNGEPEEKPDPDRPRCPECGAFMRGGVTK